MTGPHRASIRPDERVLPADPPKASLPAEPPANDPTLDEDGLPKPPDPDEIRARKGIHTDD